MGASAGDDGDFVDGWLGTEVGRQVEPVVRRRATGRLRRWLRAFLARLHR